MTHTALHRLIVVTFLLFPCTFPVAAQTTVQGNETSARVPELDRFHTVIYTIWHEAWPAKDIQRLKQLLPDIERGTAEVASAVLPGILRDKQEAWNSGVQHLQETVSRYHAAATRSDSTALLNSAEQLHAGYEALVRTIRPVSREVAAFHAELYMLYHHYLEPFVFDTVAASTARLKARMDTLNTAPLPPRLKGKEASYTAARSALSAAVDTLAAAVQSKDEQAIREAVEKMHTRYQALEHAVE